MIQNPSAWMTPYGIAVLLGIAYLLAATVMTIIGLVDIWSKWNKDNTTKIVWTLINVVLWPVGWIAVAVFTSSQKKQLA
jgi:apolipoprotein N-acyltransferase